MQIFIKIEQLDQQLHIRRTKCQINNLHIIIGYKTLKNTHVQIFMKIGPAD